MAVGIGFVVLAATTLLLVGAVPASAQPVLLARQENLSSPSSSIRDVP